MRKVTDEFKKEVFDLMVHQRVLYPHTDTQFAKSLGLSPAIYSRISRNYLEENCLSAAGWLTLARKLGYEFAKSTWNHAPTKVYQAIKEDILFCKNNSKALIFVDDCAIGKTHTAKLLAKTMSEVYYVDASQAPTKGSFIRLLAKTLGVTQKGRPKEISEDIKFFLTNIAEKPVVIIDEAGDIENVTFKYIKEIWNSTEGECGWYMIGADNLKNKIKSGIRRQLPSYREMFSRYNNKFMSIVPTEPSKRLAFYQELVEEVVKANCQDETKIPLIVKKVMQDDYEGGLRRAQTTLLMMTQD